MKSLIVVGGLLGFITGIVFGWVQQKTMPVLVFHACVAMYASAMLMRWWGKIWLKSLQQAVSEKQ